MTKAEARATKLLADLRLEEAPIPVLEIAIQLGAKVRYDPMEGDVSGMLFRRGKTSVIGINSKHAVVRQRFTIAHEIGHMLLHEGKQMVIDKSARVNLRDSKSSLATDREEIDANGFAAALLMPHDLVRSSLSRLLGNAKTVKQSVVSDLAEKFEVSIHAMTIRLANLGYGLPE